VRYFQIHFSSEGAECKVSVRTGTEPLRWQCYGVSRGCGVLTVLAVSEHALHIAPPYSYTHITVKFLKPLRLRRRGQIEGMQNKTIPIKLQQLQKKTRRRRTCKGWMRGVEGDSDAMRIKKKQAV